MNITIRNARPEDAHELAQAEREIAERPGLLVSKPFELTDERFKNTITNSLQNKNIIYLIAECNGTIVGHGLLEPLHLTAICHVAHLTLVVNSGWQGKGIGTLLLKSLIDCAKSSDGIEKIELHVRSVNERAIALYKKMGFVEEGRLKNRVKIAEGHYVDDVVMGLPVKESIEINIK